GRRVVRQRAALRLDPCWAEPNGSPHTAERLGEDARGRRLADAARCAEQEGMVHATLGERVRERAGDVLLTDDLGEGLRPVFAREDEIRHGSQTLKQIVAPVTR